MTTSRKVLSVVLVVVALLGVVYFVRSSGGSSPPDISVSDVYASETASSSSSMYMTFQNSGGPDDLVAVVVSGITQVSIHGADMLPRTHLTVKGHHTTTLAPGGGHIMLENLTDPLQPGMQLGVRLLFKKSAPIDVTADVLSYDQINEKIAS